MNKILKEVTHLELENLSLFKQGKVRYVYDFGDELLLVATDRVSAFDVVLDHGIPDKGKTLNKIAEFWFNTLDIPNHMISTKIEDFPTACKPYVDTLAGRSMLVKKTELIPFECVVRGYLMGSGWKDYQKSGSVCGHSLSPGLQLASKFNEPIFTPATKEESGHDQNVSKAYMADKIGKDLADKLEALSIKLFSLANEYCLQRGVIIADTKFEFGLLDGEILLIDEALTPDSSRFWPANEVVLGKMPPSYDKQIIRNYLQTLDWDQKNPIRLPDEVILETQRKYNEIATILMG